MPKKKTTNLYFHQGVEDAIHSYNLSTDDKERNELFKTIYPALCKISEVWRNKIKPVYAELPNEELEIDCVTFLLEKLPMIKEGKGKAFSYLTVTARNYYMQLNIRGYVKVKRGLKLDAMPDYFDIEEVNSDRVDEMEYNGKLFDLFIEYCEENFPSMFPHSKQKLFASSFFEKIKSFNFADEINRRQILNELSEQTGIERGIVTKHINRIASFYSSFKDYFELYGTKPRFKEKLIITEEDEAYIRKHYRHYSKHNGINGISRKLGINNDVLRNWVKQSHI